MKTDVLILAAGEASRWDGPGSKHLIEINGIALINRTMAQVNRCRSELNITGETFVVSSETSRRYLLQARIDSLEAKSTETTCHTLFSSFFWTPRTAVLLGDVLYTDKTIIRILTSKKHFCVFTDQVDIFGISFSDNHAIERVLRIVMSAGGGRLSDLYKAWHKIPNHTALAWIDDGTYELVDDETQDFDCVKDYTDFLAGKTKNHLLKTRLNARAR